MLTFKKPYILTALKEIGFSAPTEVQEQVIPLVMQGHDMIVEAKTGSGKTHAYLLPLLDKLDETEATTQALIMAPTVELARQIFAFAKEIVSYCPEKIDVRLFVGGGDRNREIASLTKSQPQIAIGTPGKLYDLTRQQNALKTHKVGMLVIDEADMTFAEGYLFQLDQVAATMPKDLQMLVFSATIPEKIEPFLKKYMHAPKILAIHSQEEHNLQIKHYFVKTKEVDKNIVLGNLLKTFQPYLCLIFCNTIKSSDDLFEYLKSNNYNVALVNGDITPRKRKQTIDRIRNYEYQYVVATDILSRGIDLDNISHIVNYDLPKDPRFYIHRSGRTGRMMAEGISISLYEFADNAYLDQLEALKIHCEYREVRDGELCEIKDRRERTKRERPLSATVQAVSKKIPVPKTVKPRYKVKRREKIAKKAKELRKKGRRI
ncbi:MAG: DEAD/DEAH box helicase [Candidatus Izemoplasmatales bacterium]